MNSQLQVVAAREFDGIKFECYQEYGQIDPTEFSATREQIGLALGYENPANAIKDIHMRNKDRLDKFSTQRKMRQVEGNRTVTREIFMILQEDLDA
ncbi:MAG: hypothetical protein IJG55_05370 [Synergistaceae bacterium]|nr:hypothetical protein [Synergistaceae bacterium]